MSTNLSARIDPEDFAKLQAIVAKKGISMSDLTREMVAEYLHDNDDDLRHQFVALRDEMKGEIDQLRATLKLLRDDLATSVDAILRAASKDEAYKQKYPISDDAIKNWVIENLVRANEE